MGICCEMGFHGKRDIRISKIGPRMGPTYARVSDSLNGFARMFDCRTISRCRSAFDCLINQGVAETDAEVACVLLFTHANRLPI